MNNYSSFSSFGRHIFSADTTTLVPAPLHLQQQPQPQQLQHIQNHPPANGSSTYPPPPHSSTRSPFSQGPKLQSGSEVPPRNIYYSHRSLTRLPPREAEGLSAETSHIPKKDCPHQNLTSVGRNPGPSRNSKKTNPGWYSQQTRGWPWLLWIERTTLTRFTYYCQTLTHKGQSQRTPPPT